LSVYDRPSFLVRRIDQFSYVGQDPRKGFLSAGITLLHVIDDQRGLAVVKICTCHTTARSRPQLKDICSPYDESKSSRNVSSLETTNWKLEWIVVQVLRPTRLDYRGHTQLQ